MLSFPTRMWFSVPIVSLHSIVVINIACDRDDLSFMSVYAASVYYLSYMRISTETRTASFSGYYL